MKRILIGLILLSSLTAFPQNIEIIGGLNQMMKRQPDASEISSPKSQTDLNGRIEPRYSELLLPLGSWQ